METWGCLIGRTYVNCEGPARDWNAETREFAAVPPEMTMTLGDIGVGGVLEPRSMACLCALTIVLGFRGGIARQGHTPERGGRQAADRHLDFQHNGAAAISNITVANKGRRGRTFAADGRRSPSLCVDRLP